MIKHTAWTLGVALLWSGSVMSETLRCGTSLVNVGDAVDVVRDKCGEPDSRVDHPPVLRSSSAKPFHAAKVSDWVYRSGGAKRHLRFIDDTLVSVKTTRD